MTYYVGIVFIILIISLLILGLSNRKKKKNGVFHTIKKDTKENTILVRTEIVIDNSVFDSFEETHKTLDEALIYKIEAKKRGEGMYKRAKKLLKK